MSKLRYRARTFSIVPAGQDPFEVQLRNGFKVIGGPGPHCWQGDAFRKLRTAMLGILVSLMGSGKSLVLCALVWDYIRGTSPLSPRDSAGKPIGRGIIIVPQKMISWSFLADTFYMPDGTLVEWKSWHHLCDTDDARVQDSIQEALYNFIRNRPEDEAGGRVLICSHKTSASVHKRLMNEMASTPSIYYGKDPYAGIALVADEGHHAKNESLPEDIVLDDLEIRRFRNNLGAVLQHYIVHRPGPLWPATATMMRGDFYDIIPEEYRAEFEAYENLPSEYLRHLTYLKRIVTRFIVGDPNRYIEPLMRMVASDVRARREQGLVDGPTLWYLPPINNSLLGGAKIPTLNECIAAAVAQGLVWLDLVSPEGREERSRQLRINIKNGGPLPDIIFFQDLGREGFDCPAARRVIVIGPRTSFPLIIQIFGRPLRDFPGKDEVEFLLFLPYEGQAEDTEHDQVQTYLNAIVSLLSIEWQLNPLYQHRSPRLRSIEEIEEILLASFRELVRQTGTSDEEALNEVFRQFGLLGEESQQDRDLFREFLLSLSRNAHNDDDDPEQPSALFSASLKARIAGVQGLPGPVLNVRLFDFFREYLTDFGGHDIDSYRAVVLGRLPLDIPLLHRNVRLYVARTGRAPSHTSDEILPEYPHDQALTWSRVHDAVRDGRRGYPPNGSWGDFISAAQRNSWKDEFLSDVEFWDSGAGDAASFSDYVHQHRPEQFYSSKRKCEAMYRCYRLFGERFIRASPVTAELAIALGAESLTRLARGQDATRSRFRTQLLQRLEAGEDVTPSVAASEFRVVLSSGRAAQDTR